MSQSPFRWSDFITLADTLCQSSEEANFRSCISRAYYGAFHSAKKVVNITSGGGELHQTVPIKLKNTGIRQHKTAAGMLESLRIVRNKADYDMQPMQTKQTAELALIQARKIISLLNTDSSELEYE